MKVIVDVKAEIKQNAFDVELYKKMTKEQIETVLTGMRLAVERRFPEASSISVDVRVEGGDE